MKTKAKQIQEWSIVELNDGCRGVLSHHAKKGKCVVLTIKDGKQHGIEISSNTEVALIVYASMGMQELLPKYLETAQIQF